MLFFGRGFGVQVLNFSFDKSEIICFKTIEVAPIVSLNMLRKHWHRITKFNFFKGSLFLYYHKYILTIYSYESARVYRISYNLNGLKEVYLLKKQRDSVGKVLVGAMLTI